MRVFAVLLVLSTLRIIESVIDEGKIHMMGLQAEARNWEEQKNYHRVSMEDFLNQNQIDDARAEEAAAVAARKELEMVYKDIHDTMTAL